MKKNTSILTILVILISTVLNATVLNATVLLANNSPNADPYLIILHEAIKGASNGDPLHIEASTTISWDGTFDKQIVVIEPCNWYTKNDTTPTNTETSVHSGINNVNIILKDYYVVKVVSSNDVVSRKVFIE